MSEQTERRLTHENPDPKTELPLNNKGNYLSVKCPECGTEVRTYLSKLAQLEAERDKYKRALGEIQARCLPLGFGKPSDEAKAIINITAAALSGKEQDG